MRVFQGGRWFLVTMQEADGADRLPAQEHHAGIGMAKVMQADTPDAGFFPRLRSKVVQPSLWRPTVLNGRYRSG